MPMKNDEFIVNIGIFSLSTRFITHKLKGTGFFQIFLKIVVYFNSELHQLCKNPPKTDMSNILRFLTSKSLSLIAATKKSTCHGNYQKSFVMFM